MHSAANAQGNGAGNDGAHAVQRLRRSEGKAAGQLADIEGAGSGDVEGRAIGNERLADQCQGAGVHRGGAMVTKRIRRAFDVL